MTNPFDLNLRHLRGVAAIVRAGSVSAAAQLVSLSQPALTQGVAKLEAQLSTPLFTRQAGGMEATEAGRALAARTGRRSRISPPPCAAGGASPMPSG